MILNQAEFRDRVLGCWLGKNVGGTLGAPMEWRRQINDVSFYTQELGGEPLPNDDLDIQLLWLMTLERQGLDIDRQVLADNFLCHVTPHWSEYGIARGNLRAGLLPPFSGLVGNPYRDSCGSFIRSEIWACLAPGCPRTAARLALEDSIIDHAGGEGTWAALWMAAVQSAAFVEPDLERLIDIGLTYIPADCGVAQAIAKVRQCRQQGLDWRAARNRLLVDHGGAPYAPHLPLTAEDLALGLDRGQRGYDAPGNIGILVIGLLWGEDDFGRSLCLAINCGEDTDCTGASLAALWGIRHGAAALPEKWLAPVGRGIKTVALNVGDFQGVVPTDVDNLTDRTLRQTRAMIAHRRLPVSIDANAATDLSGFKSADLEAGPAYADLFAAAHNLSFPGPFFSVAVDAGIGPDAPLLIPGQSKSVRIILRPAAGPQSLATVRWHAPAGLRILPAPAASAPLSHHLPNGVACLDFTLQADALEHPVVHCLVDARLEGRPVGMTVPVTLLLTPPS